ncbi:hypothetical protein ACFV23_08315, partial [Streptomyces sp. NPDC059627]
MARWARPGYRWAGPGRRRCGVQPVGRAGGEAAEERQAVAVQQGEDDGRDHVDQLLSAGEVLS